MSMLAMAQAEQVRNALLSVRKDLDVTLVPIKTMGDSVLDRPISKIGDKGIFVKELEIALMENQIDCAVHSLKDLPSDLPVGLCLGGVLKREDVRDVLISKDKVTLKEMGEGHRIGTSSLRRKAQLPSINSSLQIVEMRGNVQTRLHKLNENVCDALILAAAGIHRLGLSEMITEYISPTEMLPAACQGIIGIEIRSDDSRISPLIRDITHPETAFVAEAERAFLEAVEGGCEVPVGCYTTVSGNSFFIEAVIASLSGDEIIKESDTDVIVNAKSVAYSVGSRLLSNGGRQIIDTIRKIPKVILV